MLSVLKKQKVKLIYVVTHRLADVDAYCAAYATVKLVQSLTKKARVRAVFPEGLNTVAKKVSKQFSLQVDTDPDFTNADLIVIVDTNNPLLLSDFVQDIVESKARKILIDHHPIGKTTRKIADVMHVNTRASSTCEIVYDLYGINKVRMNKHVAQVLLIGIMADSQHFFLANGKTITVASELCKIGASLETARKILMRERDPSERIARLKAASRISIYTSNGFIVALSRIGSFHASAAKALVDLGADVGIAVGGNGKEPKASLRATQQFYKQSGLHLGIDIAGKISDSGGGHPTAASLSSKTIGVEELERLLFDAVEAKLGKLSVVT